MTISFNSLGSVSISQQLCIKDFKFIAGILIATYTFLVIKETANLTQEQYSDNLFVWNKKKKLKIRFEKKRDNHKHVVREELS